MLSNDGEIMRVLSSWILCRMGSALWVRKKGIYWDQVWWSGRSLTISTYTGDDSVEIWSHFKTFFSTSYISICTMREMMFTPWQRNTVSRKRTTGRCVFKHFSGSPHTIMTQEALIWYGAVLILCEARSQSDSPAYIEFNMGIKEGNHGGSSSPPSAHSGPNKSFLLGMPHHLNKSWTLAVGLRHEILEFLLQLICREQTKFTLGVNVV